MLCCFSLDSLAWTWTAPQTDLFAIIQPPTTARAYDHPMTKNADLRCAAEEQDKAKNLQQENAGNETLFVFPLVPRVTVNANRLWT